MISNRVVPNERNRRAAAVFDHRLTQKWPPIFEQRAKEKWPRKFEQHVKVMKWSLIRARSGITAQNGRLRFLRQSARKY